MNPVIIVYLLVGMVTIAVSIPLIQRRVKMNHWYGVRIPAAFASEQAWYDINHYGGRQLAVLGLVISATGLAGTCFSKEHWVAYDLTAAAMVITTVAFTLLKIYRYARSR